MIVNAINRLNAGRSLAVDASIKTAIDGLCPHSLSHCPTLLWSIEMNPDKAETVRASCRRRVARCDNMQTAGEKSY